jgi:hypothetical protein
MVTRTLSDLEQEVMKGEAIRRSYRQQRRRRASGVLAQAKYIGPSACGLQDDREERVLKS